MVNSVREQCGLEPTGKSTDFAPEQAAADDDFADCPDPDYIYEKKFPSPDPALFDMSGE